MCVCVLQQLHGYRGAAIQLVVTSDPRNSLREEELASQPGKVQQTFECAKLTP